MIKVTINRFIAYSWGISIFFSPIALYLTAWLMSNGEGIIRNFENAFLMIVIYVFFSGLSAIPSMLFSYIFLKSMNSLSVSVFIKKLIISVLNFPLVYLMLYLMNDNMIHFIPNLLSQSGFVIAICYYFFLIIGICLFGVKGWKNVFNITLEEHFIEK